MLKQNFDIRRDVIKALLIVSAITLPTKAASAVESCRNLFAQTPARVVGALIEGWTNQESQAKQIREAWDKTHFTNPAQHKASKFRYLVRANEHSEATIVEAVQNEIERFKTEYFFASSLISEATYETFSPWGYILKVPGENLIMSAPFDIGYDDHDTASNPQRYLQRYGVHTPEALLRETLRGQKNFADKDIFRNDLEKETPNAGTARDDDNWEKSLFSEIRFYGKKPGSADGENAEVIGLFVQQTIPRTNRRSKRSLIKDVQAAGRQLGLPVVVLGK